MNSDSIRQVRRFNRAVTQRVGALNDRFLSRDRPLGEARVLWEISPGGRDVRELRSNLDLDSGYLSRVLRTLESDGLVVVGPAPGDRRVRRAQLTRAGRAEWSILDRRSDEVAASIIEPLTTSQRQRLVAAMQEVERLLRASAIVVAVADPASPAARHCLAEYFAELGRRFDSGFDPTQSLPAAPDELRPPAGLFLVATLHGEPVGCAGLKFHDGAPTEVKRMWVAESVRGLGLGRRLLALVESLALEHDGPGAPLHLETNASLVEAIAMYRGHGYVEVAPFNEEPYAHHWFEKQL